MQQIDYAHYDFGKRLDDIANELMNLGGSPRTEADLTEGQRVFLRAVKREKVKYVDLNRQGYPRNLLEQVELHPHHRRSAQLLFRRRHAQDQRLSL